MLVIFKARWIVEASIVTGNPSRQNTEEPRITDAARPAKAVPNTGDVSSGNSLAADAEHIGCMMYRSRHVATYKKDESSLYRDLVPER